jgi:hypothetical protein
MSEHENASQPANLDQAIFLAERLLDFTASPTDPWAADVLQMLVDHAKATAAPAQPRFPKIVELEATDLDDDATNQLMEAPEGAVISFSSPVTGEKFNARLVDASDKAFTLVEDTSSVIVIRFGG